jgi:endonuclease-3
MRNEGNDRTIEIAGRLREKYPGSECALEYEREPWKLLVMARLSAQCTDARVNIVARDLFRRFDSIEAFAGAELEELEKAVFSCGLYKTKARNIKDMCRMLIEDYGSVVPEKMEDLLKLPGIGRKIANLIRGDVFGLPAIVADTHCIRIANRLGLCDSTDPYKVELQLAAIIAPEESSDFCHRLVFFGRECCRARAPGCEKCFLRDLCEYGLDRGENE